MYWVVWLMVGLALVAIYTTLVLPKALVKLGKRTPFRTIMTVALVSVAIFLMTFVVATFAYQCVGGLKVGPGKANVPIWALFFAPMSLILFVASAIVLKVHAKESLDLLPTLRGRDKLWFAFDIVMLVGLAAASVLLALLLYYMAMDVLHIAPGKKVLLIPIVLELALIALFERKRLRLLSGVLPKLLLPLFVVLIGLLVLYLTVSEAQLGKIFTIGETALIIMIAMTYIWSHIARRTAAPATE